MQMPGKACQQNVQPQYIHFLTGAGLCVRSLIKFAQCFQELI